MLFAISYDEQDALQAFSEEHGVGFPILSDPDSEIIRDFGILNTLVPEDDHPWFGVPFPGAYVVDRQGTIIAKFFENNLAIRPTVEQLLRAARGEDLSSELPAGTGSAGVDDVGIQIEVSTEPLAPGMQRDLVVTFSVPEGQHLYGDPVPTGMVATHIEFDDGVIALETVFPDSTPHTLVGTGETLHVFNGDSGGIVQIVVPFTHAILNRDGEAMLHLNGTVRWQACDSQSCGIPRSHRFEFTLPVGSPNVPHHREVHPGQMDFHRHFAVLNQRRGIENAT